MSEYTPDRWVIIEVNNGTGTFNRVFAGWFGGYLDGDMWKMNSGNTKEEEFEDRWEFTGYSGSVYTCYKKYYGMSGYMTTVLDGMISKLPKDMSIKIVESYMPPEPVDMGSSLQN